MRFLLDVNVWVALFDDAHVFSEQANELIETPGLQVATCPLVENGVIRVMNSITSSGLTTSPCATMPVSTSIEFMDIDRSPTSIFWPWPSRTVVAWSPSIGAFLFPRFEARRPGICVRCDRIGMTGVMCDTGSAFRGGSAMGRLAPVRVATGRAVLDARQPPRT